MRRGATLWLLCCLLLVDASESRKGRGRRARDVAAGAVLAADLVLNDLARVRHEIAMWTEISRCNECSRVHTIAKKGENAVRVAGHPLSRDLGVLVVLNDEVHAAREVTKTSTLKLQTFRSPDFGCLGHADGDEVAFYRKPVRPTAPHTEFDVRGLQALPRVDVVISYAGADGAAIRGCIAAGAEGIVSAGFAPGLCTAAERAVLTEHPEVLVVQGSRVGSGRVAAMTGLRASHNAVTGDNLTPQKARVLLMLGLTVTRERAALQRIFDTY